MKQKVNGVELFIESSGDSGPPLVLVHGSWGDHHNWDAAVQLLARTFRVTTYDRRGHSASERPGGQGSIRDDVDDLAALIEQQGVAPTHVAGNSFGAIIVLNLMIKRPDLIASATIHEPPLIGLLEGDPALAGAQQRIGAVVETLSTGHTEAGARQFVETVGLGPGMWEQLSPERRETFVFNASTWLDEMKEPGAFALDCNRLSSFGGPVLMSQGDQSPPFFGAILERIAAALPRAQRHVFRGAGHVPHLTHPDDYALVVGRFIKGVDVHEDHTLSGRENG
jgi:pimeloyl-ACP methyl ester carboxylesterase